MINPFWGEFLVSPIPLEMNMNFCSHKCAYCFANLNMPKRTMDVKQTARLIAGYRERNTYTAKLLKAGYPILVSNVSDPFSTSNYKQSVPLLSTLTDLGIPVSLQTKGGKGVDEVLRFLPVSVWYVSMSMWNDSIRERIEPGAPSIPERMDLLYKLRDMGHEIVVGINPTVPEWLPETDMWEMLLHLRDAGVSGVWVERIHLNANQEKNLSEREVRHMTPGLIRRAKTKRTPAPDMDAFCRVRDAAAAVGMHIFSVGQPNYSNFFQVYHACYPITFPTAQDFVNHLFRYLPSGSLVTFEMFADYFEPLLPAGTLTIDSYLGATAHNLWWEEKVPPQMTFRELLGWIWRSDKVKYNPARHPCFAFAGERQVNGDWLIWKDPQGMPYMIFDPNGFNSKFCEAEEQNG